MQLFDYQLFDRNQSSVYLRWTTYVRLRPKPKKYCGGDFLITNVGKQLLLRERVIRIEATVIFCYKVK